MWRYDRLSETGNQEDFWRPRSWELVIAKIAEKPVKAVASVTTCDDRGDADRIILTYHSSLLNPVMLLGLV